ncbi:hypothetical protein ABZ552_17405 [Nocardia sp. NPDC019219]|uniref:hypothetical protein n=1 Tax=Nocardia sp. NPDC019219 TaxID=3154590 RepID=UPI00340434A3
MYNEGDSTVSSIDRSENQFRESLVKYDPLTVVQRHITSGSCIMLPEEQYTELKQRISSHLEVHHSSILVVGSAKLGFSIAPAKRWMRFSERSDLDVAIVSSELYIAVWKELAALVSTDPVLDWPSRKKFRFLDRKLHGWIRPDLLPRSAALPLADEWFEYFRQLTASGDCGPYKITAGLYFDMYFLEAYQSRAVSSCRSN